MSRDSLDNDIITTIRDSGALNIAADIGEIGIDTLLKGPAKEIPILGTLVGLWRAGAQVRDMLFVHKLTKFLSELHNVPESEREAFAQQIDEDPKFKTRVGENLLLLIDRIDDINKVELVARAFADYMRCEISYELFCEFALAVDRCLLADILSLPGTKSRFKLPAPVATRLSACGLIEIHGIATIRKEGDEANYYQVTSTGQQFYDRYLKKEEQEQV